MDSEDPKLNPNSAAGRAMTAKVKMIELAEKLGIPEGDYSIPNNFGLSRTTRGDTYRLMFNIDTLNNCDRGKLDEALNKLIGRPNSSIPSYNLSEKLHFVLMKLVNQSRADRIPENIEDKDPHNCVQLRYDHNNRRYTLTAQVYLVFEQ